MRFFVARALVAFSMMAVPFYAIYIGSHLPLSGATLGYLSIAYLLAQTTSNLAWGRIADRYGYRLVFLGSIGLLGRVDRRAAALRWAGRIPAGFLRTGCRLRRRYFLSADNSALEFGNRRGPPHAAGRLRHRHLRHDGMRPGPLGGLLAQGVRFSLVFVAAIAVMGIAFALALRVEEPRRRPRPVREGSV
ncbi:hypothetical protein ACU4GD_04840 [Cupriavidus basilensis]